MLLIRSYVCVNVVIRTLPIKTNYITTNAMYNLRQIQTTIICLPLPMTRVNCPAMSPSEMGVAEESPSQGGGLWDWKPSEAVSLSAPVFVASEGEEAVSKAGCAALGGL